MKFNPYSSLKAFKVFLITFSLVISLATALIFIGMYVRTQGETQMNIIILSALTLLTIGGFNSILFFIVWKQEIRLDKAQQQLKDLGTTDELTGLRNRRYIMTRLKEEFQRAVRSELPVSVIMIDIDHFKKINESAGRTFGDVVLRTVADRLRLDLREYDLLGRTGGEEFLVILPEAESRKAHDVAHRLLQAVSSEDITAAENTVNVTLSAGVTTLKERDLSIDTILSRADDALYKAKNEGRNRAVIL
jgi:diguanylate cyclase (GGDEF)-like protein